MAIERSRDELLATFQGGIGYTFRDVRLLDQALTHSSWANEHGGKWPHNERLEFLGDAVLELCVTHVLFERFPEVREGELTRMRARLVSQPSLCRTARQIGLDDCLRLGKGEESQGGRGRASLLGDAMEAVIGAVYLDGGFEAVRRLLQELFAGHWPSQVECVKEKDYKSHLQELTQRLYKDRPAYSLLSSTGPEHAKVFEVCITLPTGQTLTAQGPSLKRAEQAAAMAAIALLRQAESGFPA